MVKELFTEKAEVLNKIQNKKAEILTLKHLIGLEETELLLNTDFKELGLTNEKQRTAYINQELRVHKREYDWLKYDLNVLENDLDMINTFIKGELNGIEK